jgi:sugar phosphate isomerase/epimerase
MRPVGLNFISALGMLPPDYVRMADELGFGHVSLGLQPMTADPYGFGGWSLRKDAGLRAETRAAAADSGIPIAMGEVVLIMPGRDVRDAQGDLDIMAELGIPAVNALSLHGNPAHSAEQLARLAALADERGMKVVLEFMAGPAVGSIATARAAISASGRRDIGLMLDCLHLERSGTAVADVAGIPSPELAYLQICDATNGPPHPGYSDEARQDRLLPGEGNLPLAGYIGAVPRDLPLGLEVPQLAKANAGVALRDYLGEALARTRNLLEQAA